MLFVQRAVAEAFMNKATLVATLRGESDPFSSLWCQSPARGFACGARGCRVATERAGAL